MESRQMKTLEVVTVLLETRSVCRKSLLLDANDMSLCKRNIHFVMPGALCQSIVVVNETSRGSADHSL
jgi:hypothetical protein